MSKLKIYQEIAEDISSCVKCDLGYGSDAHDPHIVGQGDVNAKIMFLAEAPGLEEMKTREPLSSTSASGKTYNRMLAELGLSRQDVFTTYVVACRAPDNRKAEPYEVHKCRGHLERQISLIKPKLVVTFGKAAAQAMIGPTKITKIRGNVVRSEKFDIDVYVMYQPSYINGYSPQSKKLEFKNDIKRLKWMLTKGYLNEDIVADNPAIGSRLGCS